MLDTLFANNLKINDLQIMYAFPNTVVRCFSVPIIRK